MRAPASPITVARLALPEDHLLESGDTPVEAVATEVGYSDSSFFGRLFQRKVGMTPAQYRLRFGRLTRELQGLAG